ncbi:MAG: lipoyl synthase [Acidobacteria bacterium]|nr:lipoyl synthase [Acidobacteriota bacterium]
MVTPNVPVDRPGQRPAWLKIKLPTGESYFKLKALMRGSGLHTVCESALCPNIADCWGMGTATFMILGEVCTRRCSYCAVTSGRPPYLDRDEPVKVAAAVKEMGIRHAVITSVARDDLPDGGAEIFYETIQAVRANCPGTTIEVLVPDFRGRPESVEKVMEARPEVFNHNVETVPRLYREVRPSGRYDRSLDLLRLAGRIDSSVITKSGIMVGLGETADEVIAVLADLRDSGCRYLTIGQYLRPSREHHEVARYYTPEEFAALKDGALGLGFDDVVSGPLVRSSYHARIK